MSLMSGLTEEEIWCTKLLYKRLDNSKLCENKMGRLLERRRASSLTDVSNVYILYFWKRWKQRML